MDPNAQAVVAALLDTPLKRELWRTDPAFHTSLAALASMLPYMIDGLSVECAKNAERREMARNEALLYPHRAHPNDFDFHMTTPEEH